MTQALTTANRIDPLRQALEALGERRRLFAWGARLIRSVWWWIAAVLGVIVVDAAMPLPAEVRLGLLIALIVALPGFLLMSRVRSDDARRGPLRDARTLESHHGLEHNPLINGMWMQDVTAHGDDTFAHALAARSRESGKQTMDHVDGEVVIDRGAVRRQGGYIWAAVVAWLVILIIQPHLIVGGLARLIDPWGDHPPFSLTRIAVTASPEEVTEGDDVDVTAELSGVIPASAELVELDANHEPVRRWPMRAMSSDAFGYLLRSLTEPMTFQVEAGGGRSHRFEIDPQARVADAEDEEQYEDEPTPEMTGGGDPSDAMLEMDGQLASELPEIFFKLQMLAAQAESIREQADKLANADPNEVDLEQWKQDLAELDSEVSKFREDASELAQQCRALAATSYGDRKRALEQLASVLESLSACQFGQCPNPGQGPGNNPGFGAGSGMGSGYLAFGPPGLWVNGINQAAQLDSQLLAEMFRAMSASLGGAASQTDADATALLEAGRATRSDGYHESAPDAIEHDQPDAVTRQTPPSYRELVARYFDRLAEDETDTGTGP